MSHTEEASSIEGESVHVKSFRMKVDSVDEETGTFDAYASVFNVLDSDAEIVLPGAFNRSLNNNQGVVVLADHDIKKHIGFNVEAHEDGYGLRVKAQLALDNSAARDKYALIKLAQKLNSQGLPVKAGISIGFRAIQTKMMSGRELKSVKGADPNRTYRCFTECALVEYSVVALAANQEAFVTAVKAKYDANSQKYVSSALDVDEDEAAEGAEVTTTPATAENNSKENHMEDINEKSGRSISAATADKIKMAMDHITKGMSTLQDLYLANDTNLPNPVGGGKSEKSEKESDSQELHSLLELARSVAEKTKAA